MNSLLSELRNGKFKYVTSKSGVSVVLYQYLTNSKKNIYMGTGVPSGPFVYVNKVRQSHFMAWRIKRALRKGSLK